MTENKTSLPSDSSGQPEGHYRGGVDEQSNEVISGIKERISQDGYLEGRYYEMIVSAHDSWKIGKKEDLLYLEELTMICLQVGRHKYILNVLL
ncbi:hypothetical protein D6810_00980 [Candidatus Dojkabacteria bacterium]|uniref:Uncharacterized protein n=1 Tax=Candidatus Dojkabacteria bacterium TaxID=2099670 RepID=A0A3M0Z306_9BACT|nr:MAG: hypothetical protein D6810_00980 [Candidatus Dojkabacteria bacterium]